MRYTLFRRGIIKADLVVGLFIILFVSALALCDVVDKVETKARITCASNLRQIGQAILMYSNENRAAYPRTIYDRARADSPTWGSGPEKSGTPDPFAKDSPLAPNDVSAALFLILRYEDITTTPFTCPSTKAKPWDFEGPMNTAQNWVNWPRSILAQHLSYSYQNPYPTAAAARKGFKLNSSIAKDFAVAADMNPGAPELAQLTLNSPPEQIRACNSPNHNRDGQNVLFGDGHVDFENNPFCGVKRDNIYTSAAKTKDGIVGPPDGPGDSILLPIVENQKSGGENGI